MDKYSLRIKWDYTYDKEGSWFDNDCGEDTAELIAGTSYPLPHMRNKYLDILSVSSDGDTVTAEVSVDHKTITLHSGEEPVTAHASSSYSVAGDSVHQSLCLGLGIEKL